MKKRIFSGVATALVTPMNEDYKVDFDRLEKLVDEQIKGGVDSLVICGTTGESATLSTEEHVEVIKVAVDAAAKRIPIIAGTGSNDTFYAVDLSNKAEAVGADALLMVTPYYNKTSQSGLIKHYNYIADRVSSPIVMYNVPSRTGTAIKPETYKILSEHKNIVAVKEANGDLASIVKTKYLCGDNLDVYSGNDDETVPIISVGGAGIISVLSNIAPGVMHKMCKFCFDGDYKSAAQMQIKYSPLMRALFADVNPIPIKYAMNSLGMNMGKLRLPLVEPDEATKKLIDDEMKKVELF